VSVGGIRRGTVCWATVPAGFEHDQGTRPWLVVSRVLAGLPRALAMPISTASPGQDLYPVTWPVPPAWGLPQACWVRVDHVRSVPVERLRDPFAEASRDELLEILDALGALLGASINPR
jgi:mRNA-degrading endonuclease toxin of MazEF toxin-antitoxin module